MKTTNTIALGCDHGGFPLKAAIKKELQEKGYVVQDFGTYSADSVDYPDYAEKVAQAIVRQEHERGILICGTGIGMSMAANKVPGIRAAVCWDTFTAQMSRTHNNSNLLCLGGRVLSEKEALEIISVWLEESFQGGRHQKRIDKMKGIEKKYCRK